MVTLQGDPLCPGPSINLSQGAPRLITTSYSCAVSLASVYAARYGVQARLGVVGGVARWQQRIRRRAPAGWRRPPRPSRGRPRPPARCRLACPIPDKSRSAWRAGRREPRRVFGPSRTRSPSTALREQEPKSKLEGRSHGVALPTILDAYVFGTKLTPRRRRFRHRCTRSWSARSPWQPCWQPAWCIGVIATSAAIAAGHSPEALKVQSRALPLFSSPLWIAAGTLANESAVALTLLVALRRLKLSRERVLPLKRPAPSSIFAALLVVFGAAPLADAAAELCHRWVGSDLTATELVATAARGAGPGSLVLLIFALAVVPAVVEESMFRGFVTAAFAKSPLAAFLVPTLLFGAFHLEPTQAAGTLVLGAGFALARLWTGSLVPGIVVHAVYNAAVIFAVRYSDEVPQPGRPIELVADRDWTRRRGGRRRSARARAACELVRRALGRSFTAPSTANSQQVDGRVGPDAAVRTA